MFHRIAATSPFRPHTSRCHCPPQRSTRAETPPETTCWGSPPTDHGLDRAEQKSAKVPLAKRAFVIMGF